MIDHSVAKGGASVETRASGWDLLRGIANG